MFMPVEYIRIEEARKGSRVGVGVGVEVGGWGGGVGREGEGDRYFIVNAQSTTEVIPGIDR